MIKIKKSVNAIWHAISNSWYTNLLKMNKKKTISFTSMIHKIIIFCELSSSSSSSSSYFASGR